MDRLAPASSPSPQHVEHKLPTLSPCAFFLLFLASGRPGAQSHACTNLLETIYRLLIRLCLFVPHLLYPHLPSFSRGYIRHRLTVPACIYICDYACVRLS